VNSLLKHNSLQKEKGGLDNGLPPHKRPKSGEAVAGTDPFGDHDDFTADDLEEIDIIASQALSQGGAARFSERLRPVLFPEGRERTSNILPVHTS
uniref:Uncharacterized protein n=1 Tax=Apteryx owenii TaxID=8824 RepID=A0A8B9QFQ2_APTOW